MENINRGCTLSSSKIQ